MTIKREYVGRETIGRSYAGSLYSGSAVTVAGGHLYQGREYFGLQTIGRLFRNVIPSTNTDTPLVGRWTGVLQVVGAPRRIELSKGSRVDVRI